MRRIVYFTDEVMEALSGQVTCPKAHSWEEQGNLNLAPFYSKAGCFLFTCIDTVLHSLCAKQYASDYKGHHISGKGELLWIK